MSTLVLPASLPALSLLLIELFAACVIVWQAIGRINRMSRCTSLPIFASWVLLGGSGAAILANLCSGTPAATPYSATLTIGVAVILLTDRRRR